MSNYLERAIEEVTKSATERVIGEVAASVKPETS
jgi:hypothetical protein